MRRYGIGYCLDVEHLQMEMCGIFEEDFLRVMKLTFHVHLTGYSFGTMNWNTPIHHASNHRKYILKLLKKVNYSGMVVSEAKVSYQTIDEFIMLKGFIQELSNKDIVT